MKQLIQNMKVLRAMSGRFLTVAVVAAAALTFNTQAQTDPGQGAVVTFLERDHPGFFESYTPDGQLMLHVDTSSPGTFVRSNPDGTLTINVIGTQAPMTISILDDGDYIPAWIGSGSFHMTQSVEPVPGGGLTGTGEASYIHVQGTFTSLVDGSLWSLHAVVVEQDQEFKILTIDFQPK